MADVENQSKGGAPARDRYIPVRKTDIVQALVDHGGDSGGLPAAETEKFRRLARRLGAIYHYDYFDRLEALRNDYYYFNPDLPPGAPIDPAMLARAHDELVATLANTLATADFVELAPDDVVRSHKEHPVLKVEIEIPADDYREVRFFRRGQHRDTVEVAEWLGLRKRRVEVDVYDNLVLMVMVKPAGEISKRLARHLARNRLRPGTILIKYFRDVARSDLNMLFPDVRVVPGLLDMLTLGLPAIAGGIPIILNLLPTISVLFAVAAVYLGFSGTVHDDDAKKALAALSGLLALGGFLARQWLKFKSQSLKYHKAISDNVYYRNINNNAGALDAIVGTAEEQECKEAFLAYYFLATAVAPLTQDELARRIERWLNDTFRVEIDFAIGEALAKLERLKLLRRDGEALTVPPLDAAEMILDRAWGEFFPVE
jgi:Protein of unknown function (DUF3754)